MTAVVRRRLAVVVEIIALQTGQASGETALPDGRTVFIAGEHEDHYDPDFFIYNDVVIVSRDRNHEILGYSIDSFPPADFHSATLVGDRDITAKLAALELSSIAGRDIEA